MKLSSADKRLLDALQQDATRAQADLAEIAGMSRTSAESGLIQGQVALLDPQKAGFHIQVLLAVAMTEHTDENRRNFEDHITCLSAVTECFTVAGERDYVLHVVVPDMETYTEFLQSEILKHPSVRSASSTFVLQRIKYTTMLPLSD
jgi:Lrp/AsnC family transcriptional regulator